MPNTLVGSPVFTGFLLSGLFLSGAGGVGGFVGVVGGVGVVGVVTFLSAPHISFNTFNA